MTKTTGVDIRPLCFVLMPFGSKPDPSGGPNIDFDKIYTQAIAPGIEDAGLFPLRADEEKLGGIIHKQMFERLLYCAFAVADLTTSNPNVLYELGIRHAARPRTTLTIYAASNPLPFDVNLLRTERYQLDSDNKISADNARKLRKAVARHLTELKSLSATEDFVDSPLFQLVSGLHPELLLPANVEFRDDVVKRNELLKEQLRQIRKDSAEKELWPSLMEQLASIKEQALASESTDVGVLTEIMRTYRTVNAWPEMIAVYDVMPEGLQRQVQVRQLLAFAYNRRAETNHDVKDRNKALTVLEELQDEQGCNPETSGLIGRIYKTRWQEAVDADDAVKAEQFLLKAIDAYHHGFDADWREVYPGVNAVTLLDVKGDEDALALKDRLLPVVRFAAEQNLRGHRPTYWDHATLLELAVLAGDKDEAEDRMDDALSSFEEKWCLETTANNLGIIASNRRRRGLDVGWISALIAKLEAATR